MCDYNCHKLHLIKVTISVLTRLLSNISVCSAKFHVQPLSQVCRPQCMQWGACGAFEV